MYQIKEIELQHGEYTRKRLIIEFNDNRKAILGEFLMTDAIMFKGELAKEVKEVVEHRRGAVQGSGNRTSWLINEQQAVIEDLFASMEQNIPSYSTCVIETTKLYNIMLAWFQAQENFQE